MNRIIFITGGARSGKSSFAESVALQINRSGISGSKAAYIATAQIADAEFQKRIEKHRQKRGDMYQIYEEGLELSALLKKINHEHSVFLIECLTTWLGNVFFHKGQAAAEDFISCELDQIGLLFQKKAEYKPKELPEMLHQAESGDFSPGFYNILHQSKEDKRLIIVSNELGQGIVPADPESRSYRDVHGRMNQRMAEMADFAYYTIAGLIRRIK